VTALRRVVIGADTHRDTNHLAVITDAGKPLADAEFPTSPAGYDDALRWARTPEANACSSGAAPSPVDVPIYPPKSGRGMR
jgi:hypothetical protein